MLTSIAITPAEHAARCNALLAEAHGAGLSGVVLFDPYYVLYYTAPDAELRGFRWATPGAGVAIAVWALASAAFALYVANFGSYDKTYGTLGGLVALLVWLWITNVAILFGHALNAQLERDAPRTPPRSSS